MNDFGRWLEREMLARHLGVREFADALGIDHGLVSRYINGKQNPSRTTVRKIAATLQLAAADLDAMVPDRRRRRAPDPDEVASHLRVGDVDERWLRFLAGLDPDEREEAFEVACVVISARRRRQASDEGGSGHAGNERARGGPGPSSEAGLVGGSDG